MSYEKQTWQTGDVVTSAKLNHMEDGIAGGSELPEVFEIPLTRVEGGGATTTVTFAQLKAAWDAGKRVYVPLFGAYIVTFSESSGVANAFLYNQGLFVVLSLQLDVEEDDPLLVNMASYDLSSL